MADDVKRLIMSREELTDGLEKERFRKTEAEGGCGVVGFASSRQVEGRYLNAALGQMRNRGNGKGGGVAAVGLSADQLGVPERILRDDYLLLVAYLDEGCRENVEREHILPYLNVDSQSEVAAVEDYRRLGLEVCPPRVHRYFVRAKKEALETFIAENRLEDCGLEKAEDEFIYQNSFRLNKQFYYSLGEQKAFVLSHGKDMVVFKLVGYGEQVLQYYNLEDLKAFVWIGHHRYPTKGLIWHPGGAHPFIGLHEALVHNGDFANYHSICDYLKQRHIYPLFLTDTEVSVQLFDLYRRIYDYPLEYVFEALAPTTEHDFEMLPEEKKEMYRNIQAAHIHGSPDGPWFFIIARNDNSNNEYQLIGITDTSMLRPQVFALQESADKIGLIASEKQAIDAVLRSLYEDGRLPSPIADRYWNARGGSYTDGGSFVYSVERNGGHELKVTNKFGVPVQTREGYFLNTHQPDYTSPAAFSGQIRELFNPSASGMFEKVSGQIANYAEGEIYSLFEEICSYAQTGQREQSRAIEALTLLYDLRYDTGAVKRCSFLNLIQETLYRVFVSNPRMGEGNSDLRYRQIDRETRSRLGPPADSRNVLIIDAGDFPPEGEDSLALFLVQASKLGWEHLIVFNLRGQRFLANGFGPGSRGTVHLYGTPGDNCASGMDGVEVYVHGSAQDQTAKILKSGKLVIYGDVGQAFMYASKGGEVFVLGNAAGRPLINSVGNPRVVINGTALDYLGESFMAGDPFNGGGFVIVNGIEFDDSGSIRDLETPYPGSNLFSLASGGALYVRDPYNKITEGQLNGSAFAPFTETDWRLISPYLEENERLFHIPVKSLLSVDGRTLDPSSVYRKVAPVPH
ncbi:MAG: hypothetical protein PVF22_07620 [Candidatus Aminicenantes bacterium]|jgi:glutamate synthase domain-containing protein 1/glutamate synthase domain-containing protein 3